jgi:hypothetical protein
MKDFGKYKFTKPGKQYKSDSTGYTRSQYDAAEQGERCLFHKIDEIDTHQ